MTQATNPTTQQKQATMSQHPLMGTICGDIISIPYERPAEKRTKDYNFEQAIRNAVSLGGDADTQVAIAGSIGIATPGWTIPQEWYDKAYGKVSEVFRQIMGDFTEKYL